MVQIAPPRSARRREILRRAAGVFRRKGYHASGMREIAQGLGLAPGALYYYFRSKDDLLFAVQDETLRRLAVGAREILRRPVGAAARLRALAAHHLECTLGELGGSLAHVDFRALPAGRLAGVLRRRDAYEALVRRLVREGVRRGEFRRVDPALAALWVLGGLNWAVVWWRPEGRQTPAQIASAFGDLLLCGLGSPGATSTAAREEDA